MNTAEAQSRQNGKKLLQFSELKTESSLEKQFDSFWRSL
jgi:hypothetical protein